MQGGHAETRDEEGKAAIGSGNGHAEEATMLRESAEHQINQATISSETHTIMSENNVVRRGRKRKVIETDHPADHATPRHKRISPPWKKVAVEGPTSFKQDGRRKSARTNAVPFELQAPSDKRQTRAAVQHSQASTYPSPGGSQKRRRTRMSPHPIKPITPGSKRTTNAYGHHSHDLNAEGAGSQAGSKRSPQKSGMKNRARSCSTDNVVEITYDELNNTAISAAMAPTMPEVVKVKRIKLNYRPPAIPVLNPRNMLLPRRYTTMGAFLEQDNPLEGETVQKLDAAKAREEARVMLRLRDAQKPGGLLDNDRWYKPEIDEHPNPLHQFSHPDYLLKHMENLHMLMDKERKRHMKEAKTVAHYVLVAWRRRQPQTQEQLDAEVQRRLETTYKRVVKEVEGVWNDSRSAVDRERFNAYKKEQLALGKQALDDMLDHSSELLNKRRERRIHIEHATMLSATYDPDEDICEKGSSLYKSSDDELNMSSSTSDDSADSERSYDSNNELTVQELRQKYAAVEVEPSSMLNVNDAKAMLTSVSKPVLPSVPTTPVVQGMETSEQGELNADSTETLNHELGSVTSFDDQFKLEEVDNELLDDSDDESDDDSTSDSEDYKNDSDDGSVAESEDDGCEEEVELGTYGFLSKQDLEALQAADQDTKIDESQVKPQAPSEDLEDVHMEHGTITPYAPEIPDPELAEIPNIAVDVSSTSDNRSGQFSPSTDSLARRQDVDSVSSVEITEDEASHLEAVTVQPGTVRLKIPSLLRGQLREYQHYGLDWLAGMHFNNTNGILADEMGLGKTIQTIALLAHLAEDRGIWGPHLIVVPTSVMLNWEMEFKKFCPGFKILTYYGTQEERKAKRKGWMDPDRWHVCITSYQLALQDAASLKRRRWHYMVLDEAHNIKNFKSQRWQTLLSFNSEARLLLTGTPLQNNVTELWSLLFFLAPHQDADGKTKFSDLKTWSNALNRPVSHILDYGREAMSDEDKDSIKRLHGILRPHLLRRLKADVEKQMPKKYEHIIKCRLSKRQRELYDGYMGLARTKDSFASGNYLSIINCLMQLRKVCNHPDLFEARQIVTSFTMPKSAVASYEIKELLVRRRLLNSDGEAADRTELLNLWGSNLSTIDTYRSHRLAALLPLKTACQRQNSRICDLDYNGKTVQSAWSSLELSARRSRLDAMQDQARRTKLRIHKRPVYGTGLLKRLTIDLKTHLLINPPFRKTKISDWYLSTCSSFQDIIVGLAERAQRLEPTVAKFACITPNVTTPDMARIALTRAGIDTVESAKAAFPGDAFHEARMRLSIAFPDRRLVQYDCGKLQQLDLLLRQLQTGGHRALIFTQMTKVLDILERFLNLHGHRYLRLDGATKIEQRQIMTDRFNNDPRILVFILSSRSGGLGINLTGADTVIFYDLDWNPAMDKQCQDRCHRIGQTRDVHIYRFVSEGTIEANILRKSNQKRMLDDVVIQEGDFTTEYFDKMQLVELHGDEREAAAAADAALDKVLGSGTGVSKQAEVVLEGAEDKEDVEAAKTAETEYVHMDDADFNETSTFGAGTLNTDAPSTPIDKAHSPLPPTADSPTKQITSDDNLAKDVSHPQITNPDPAQPDPGELRDYMSRFLHWELRDTPFALSSDQARKMSKKGKDQGIRIRR